MLQKKINLTKTIRKLPIKDNLERAGYYVHDDLANQEVKYDSHEEWFKVRGTAALWRRAIRSYTQWFEK